MWGFAGASPLRDTIEGLELVGTSVPHWPHSAVANYGNGMVWKWRAKKDPWWSDFVAAVAANPPTKLYVSPAVKGPVRNGEIWAFAQMLNHVTDETGLEPSDVYVGAIHEFSPDVTCYQAIEQDVYQRSKDLADWSVSSFGFNPGPYLGPLDDSLLNLPSDPCHPNADGKLLVGGQFKTWIESL